MPTSAPGRAAAARSSSRGWPPRTVADKVLDGDPRRAVLDPHARRQADFWVDGVNRRRPVTDRPHEPHFRVSAVSRGRSDPIPRTISWRNAVVVRVLDQRALPARIRFLALHHGRRVVRRDPIAGDPRRARARRGRRVRRRARRAHFSNVRGRCARLQKDRGDPADRGQPPMGCRRARSPPTKPVVPTAPRDGGALADDDVARNRAHRCDTAPPSFPRDAQVLTHCNTGALACVGYGTALGVVRAAVESGARPMCGSTRPDRCCKARGSRRGSSNATRHRRDAGRGHRSRVADGARARSISSSSVRTASSRTVTSRTRSVPTRSRCSRGITAFRSTSRRPCRRSTSHTATGAGIAIEERDGDEVRAVRGTLVAPAGDGGAQPGVRRDAGAPGERHHHRGRRRPPAVRPLAAEPRAAGRNRRCRGDLDVVVAARP